jgi:hypothetical protein
MNGKKKMIIGNEFIRLLVNPPQNNRMHSETQNRAVFAFAYAFLEITFSKVLLALGAGDAQRSVASVKYNMKKDKNRIKISKIKHLKLVFTDYRSEDKYLLEEYNCLYLVRVASSKWRLESPQGHVIAEHKEIDQLNVEAFF